MTSAKGKIISHGVSKTETSFCFVLRIREVSRKKAFQQRAMQYTEQRPRESNADSIDVHGHVMCREW